MDHFEATQIIDEPDTTNDNSTQKKQIGTLHLASKEFPIVEGSNRIGRSPLCSIVIIDPTVSKVHAEFQAGIEATFVCDQRSSNGTTFKGQSLKPFFYYPINDGDVIVFGQVRAVYSSSINKQSERQVDIGKTTGVQTKRLDANRKSCSSPIPEDDVSVVNLNESVIPGSQRKEKKQPFRLPGRPIDRQQNRKSNAGSMVKDSEMFVEKNQIENKEKGNEVHDAKTKTTIVHGKNQGSSRVRLEDSEPTDRINVSGDGEDIFEMETQKTVDLPNVREESNIAENDTGTEDIFEMETQKIVDPEENTNKSCMAIGSSNMGKKEKEFQNDLDIDDIFEMPTQKDDDQPNDKGKSLQSSKVDATDLDADDIYEMETQTLFNCPKNKSRSNISTGSPRMTARNNKSGAELGVENIYEMATQKVCHSPARNSKSTAGSSETFKKKDKSRIDVETEETEKHLKSFRSKDTNKNIHEMETQRMTDTSESTDKSPNTHSTLTQQILAQLKNKSSSKSLFVEKNDKPRNDVETEDIQEMDTQVIVDRPKDTSNEKNDKSCDDVEMEDIHEMETQVVIHRPKKASNDISEMATQRMLNIPSSKRQSPNIYEMETQKIVDSPQHDNRKRPRLRMYRKDSVASDRSHIIELDEEVLIGLDEIITNSPSSTSGVNLAGSSNIKDDNGIDKKTIEKMSKPKNDVIAETDDESSDDDVTKPNEFVDDSDGSVTDEENKFSSWATNKAPEDKKEASSIETPSILLARKKSTFYGKTKMRETVTLRKRDSSFGHDRIVDDDTDLLPMQVLDVATSTPNISRKCGKRSADQEKRKMKMDNTNDSTKKLMREEIADSSTGISTSTSKQSSKNENLDDSIVLKLGDMFGSQANNKDDTIDEPTQMMTQNLVDILKPTQGTTRDDDDESDAVSRVSPGSKKIKVQDVFGDLQGFVDGRAVESPKDFSCEPSSSTTNKKAGGHHEGMDRDEISTEARSHLTLADHEDDILFGLPEVRISGTLSNPGSPASSTVSSENDLIPSNWRTNESAREASIDKVVAPDAKEKKNISETIDDSRLANVPESPLLKKKSRLTRKRVFTNTIMDDQDSNDSDDPCEFNYLRALADKLLASNDKCENEKNVIETISRDKSRSSYVIKKKGIATRRRARELSENSLSLIVADVQEIVDHSVVGSIVNTTGSAGKSNAPRETRKRTRYQKQGKNKDLTEKTAKKLDASVDESLKSGRTNEITTMPMMSNNAYAKVQLTRLDEVQLKKGLNNEIVETTPKVKRARRGNSMSVKTIPVASPTTQTRTKNRRTIGHPVDNDSSMIRENHKILFTGFIDNEYNEVVAELGAKVVSEPSKASVLITNKIRRTFKFLVAVALGIKVVSIAWLMESKKAGRFLNCDDFVLDDPETEEKYKFKLSKSLHLARASKLFSGYTIVMTPKVNQPQIHEIKDMVEACGGRVLVRAARVWDAKTVIVSTEEDLAAAKAMLSKTPKNLKITIQSTEFIITGILRQEINLVEHKLN